MTDPDLTPIREMCSAFDVTARTLRFYESRGLLAPVRQGTRRLFTRRDRARLALILQGRRFGFSLDQIGALLDLYDLEDGGLRQTRAACEMGRARLDDMIRQRDELDQAIAALRHQLAEAEARLARTTPPTGD